MVHLDHQPKVQPGLVWQTEYCVDSDSEYARLVIVFYRATVRLREEHTAKLGVICG